MAEPRIGVVGCGWWATQQHIPSLVDFDDAELTALVDPDEKQLRRAGEQYGISQLYTSADELYASGEVDGVIVAVPHAHHYELVAGALAAGIHVLVEKPMVLRAAHAWDLVRTARDVGLHLMVGYTFQFTDAAWRCREILAGGDLGELLCVSGTYASMVESFFRGRPDDYREVFQFPVTGPGEATYSDPRIAGGGQGQTQVTHAMGMVLYVTDRRVAEVTAFMDNRDLDVDLVDAIAYRFRDGGLGTMAAIGSLTPEQPQQQEIRYYGTRGLLIQDLVGGLVSVHYDDGREEHLETPEEEIYPAKAPARTFADLIAGRCPNRAPPVPAARTVEFLEAAYRSAQRGEPVRISDLEGADRGE